MMCLPSVLTVFSLLIIGVHANCKSSISMLKLQGFTVRSFQSPSIHECFQSCKKNTDCLSINYYTIGSLCEHNNRTISQEPKNAVQDERATYFDDQVDIPYRDCLEIYESGEKRSGIYPIKPDSQRPFQVYCDMTTDGGGWTVFQRRQDGSVDFYRDWQQYKKGFGDLKGEFWLGNDYIYRLTARTPWSLRVDLQDWGGVHKHAKYGSFSISAESDKYRLKVSSYSGTAGDSFAQRHNNLYFSTKDRDNDPTGSGNCAVTSHGAWWYDTCYSSNLNGYYFQSPKNNYTAMAWDSFHSEISLKSSEMKIRR
ncbi:ryncolin-2-like [Actinia tenebrosa]|uniref:Ryncolin-2-like n=1 Tax=Actinia tenebrosa TaxID=6105 RepID=A0A6P8I5A4_ACTTE|nr:ryncolin-2-like [Actinia tenebrosa]